MKHSSILIIGTGALANLFAARLVAADVDVTMLGTWPAGLNALRRHGVRVGDVAYPVRVATDPADCVGIRLALVLVKSWQTERATGALRQVLPPNGLALTLQNGVGNREILAHYLGEERAAQGVTTTGATLLGPGHVRPAGEGTITLGEHPRLAAISHLLAKAGFDVKTVPNVASLVWSKLLINVAINPLTALLRVPNGRLLEIPPARDVMAEAVQEVVDVARVKTIPLTFEDPLAAAEEVARRTAANRSSMLQDVTRGAPTEIDAICGAVVRAGQAANVPTPVNRTLLNLVQASIEAGSRESGIRESGNRNQGIRKQETRSQEIRKLGIRKLGNQRTN
ncbi:MAG: 2-dehydropantoate 2-reductase [Chloroflexi bacterium]|nr:2-dehydropantoate 2-reductase [Chloroflexota bacterium]